MGEAECKKETLSCCWFRFGDYWRRVRKFNQ